MEETIMGLVDQHHLGSGADAYLDSIAYASENAGNTRPIVTEQLHTLSIIAAGYKNPEVALRELDRALALFYGMDHARRGSLDRLQRAETAAARECGRGNLVLGGLRDRIEHHLHTAINGSPSTPLRRVPARKIRR